MKLHSATIKRFRAIDEVELNFDDVLGDVRPITVLAGPNGCGKTSAIFAIIQTLRGVMGYRTADVPPPTEFDIHRKVTSTGLAAQPTSTSVTLKIEFEPCERSAIPQVLQDTEQPMEDEEIEGGAQQKTKPPVPQEHEIPDGRVEVTWAYPPDRRRDGTQRPSWMLREVVPYAALAWFRGRKRAIRGWIDGKLSKPELIDQIGGIWLFPQDRNLDERVVGGTTSGGSGRGPSGVDLEEETGGIYDAPELKSVWGILERLSSEARYRREEHGEDRSSEKQIQDIFHRVCAPKEYLGFRYPNGGATGAPYFKDGDSVYPLHQAASGEQVIIEYITRLMYPTPLNHSLILIDEPEVHLHPGWVRQVYRALPHIGIGNQYILTTHSPDLRAMASAEGSLVDLGDLQT
jgi:hypothetical protein